MGLIIYNQSMGNNIESNWLKIAKNSKYYTKHILSLEINWTDVVFDIVPSPKGLIKLYYSNSQLAEEEFMQINIDNIDNTNNPELIEINNSYKYLKIKYEAVDILEGLLNVITNVA